MNEDASLAPQWATTSGDVWARRWRDTDAGLAGLSPHLLNAITRCAPAGPFSPFGAGGGAGSPAMGVAESCPNAKITACDISAALVQVAQERTATMAGIRVLMGDA